MKQPRSKLPFVDTSIYCAGFCQISDSNAIEIFDEGLYYNDLHYILQACNNFPKAIELLNQCQEIIQEFEDIKWRNNESPFSIDEDLISELNEFLEKIENE